MTTAPTTSNEEAAQEEVMDMKTFLESVPPGQEKEIKDLANLERTGYGTSTKMHVPEIQLHCSGCDGVRYFKAQGNHFLEHGHNENFVHYVCRNCNKEWKSFAIYSTLDKNNKSGGVYKLGELPAFGAPIPRRVLNLLGPEKEYFLKGRRAENQSLGIAAFAYYRRVVEKKKAVIFDEIIKVAEKLGGDDEVIAELVSAKSEPQFASAIESIKHGIPKAIFINGQNPLLLLYSALSEGIHAQTDEECLSIATSVRIVLVEFIEKMENVVGENKELNDAVTRLLKARQEKKQKGQG